MRERADGGNDRWRAGPEGVKLLIVTQSCEKVEVEGGRRVLEEEWRGRKGADAKEHAKEQREGGRWLWLSRK